MTTKIYFDVFCKDSISFPGCAILQILLTKQVLHVKVLKQAKLIFSFFSKSIYVKMF